VNQCSDLSCHSRIIGQNSDRLMLGPLVLRRTLYTVYLRMLKSNKKVMSGAPKMTPFTTFSIIGNMLAYGLNAPQTARGTIFRLLTVIKSVLCFVSNGHLVAEIWSFQVLRWWSAPKLGLHLVYMLGY
jgi:hypothetical protein